MASPATGEKKNLKPKGNSDAEREATAVLQTAACERTSELPELYACRTTRGTKVILRDVAPILAVVALGTCIRSKEHGTHLKTVANMSTVSDRQANTNVRGINESWKRGYRNIAEDLIRRRQEIGYPRRGKVLREEG